MKATFFRGALTTAVLGVAVLAFSNGAQAASDAEKLTKKQCGMCHDLTAKKKSLLGPPLFGIVGAEAGKTDFKKYTDAMKSSGITWTAEELDKFIANPMGTVSGTSMKYKGVKDAADREAIIGVLSSLK